MADVVIRTFEEDDFDSLVEMWHDTNRVSYPYVAAHQEHTLVDARKYFRDHVIAENSVWVASSVDGELVGLIAIAGKHIAQLSVTPSAQRKGIGTLLLKKAMLLSPEAISLYTFQKNRSARSFYEKHGFVVVKFGVSPSPENEPDVEYRWEPGGDASL